ncbi:unnamed protein product, partial [Closterium sp. Naga37s-1]
MCLVCFSVNCMEKDGHTGAMRCSECGMVSQQFREEDNEGGAAGAPGMGAGMGGMGGSQAVVRESNVALHQQRQEVAAADAARAAQAVSLQVQVGGGGGALSGRQVQGACSGAHGEGENCVLASSCVPALCPLPPLLLARARALAEHYCTGLHAMLARQCHALSALLAPPTTPAPQRPTGECKEQDGAAAAAASAAAAANANAAALSSVARQILLRLVLHSGVLRQGYAERCWLLWRVGEGAGGGGHAWEEGERGAGGVGGGGNGEEGWGGEAKSGGRKRRGGGEMGGEGGEALQREMAGWGMEGGSGGFGGMESAAAQGAGGEGRDEEGNGAVGGTGQHEEEGEWARELRAILAGARRSRRREREEARKRARRARRKKWGQFEAELEAIREDEAAERREGSEGMGGDGMGVEGEGEEEEGGKGGSEKASLRETWFALAERLQTSPFFAVTCKLHVHLPLHACLAALFLACHYLRLPLLPTDICHLALSGSLPYLSAWRQLSPFQGYPASIPSATLFRPLALCSARLLELLAASAATSIALRLPPLNFRLIGERFLQVRVSSLHLPLSRSLHLPAGCAPSPCPSHSLPPARPLLCPPARAARCLCCHLHRPAPAPSQLPPHRGAVSSGARLLPAPAALSLPAPACWMCAIPMPLSRSSARSPSALPACSSCSLPLLPPPSPCAFLLSASASLGSASCRYSFPPCPSYSCPAAADHLSPTLPHSPTPIPSAFSPTPVPSAFSPTPIPSAFSPTPIPSAFSPNPPPHHPPLHSPLLPSLPFVPLSPSIPLHPSAPLCLIPFFAPLLPHQELHLPVPLFAPFLHRLFDLLCPSDSLSPSLPSLLPRFHLSPLPSAWPTRLYVMAAVVVSLKLALALGSWPSLTAAPCTGASPTPTPAAAAAAAAGAAGAGGGAVVCKAAAAAPRATVSLARGAVSGWQQMLQQRKRGEAGQGVVAEGSLAGQAGEGRGEGRGEEEEGEDEEREEGEGDGEEEEEGEGEWDVRRVVQAVEGSRQQLLQMPMQTRSREGGAEGSGRKATLLPLTTTLSPPLLLFPVTCHCPSALPSLPLVPPTEPLQLGQYLQHCERHVFAPDATRGADPSTLDRELRAHLHAALPLPPAHRGSDEGGEDVERDEMAHEWGSRAAERGRGEQVDTDLGGEERGEEIGRRKRKWGREGGEREGKGKKARARGERARWFPVRVEDVEADMRRCDFAMAPPLPQPLRGSELVYYERPRARMPFHEVHADLFVLLRAAARVARVHVRALHFCTMEIEDALVGAAFFTVASPASFLEPSHPSGSDGNAGSAVTVASAAGSRVARSLKKWKGKTVVKYVAKLKGMGAANKGASG